MDPLSRTRARSGAAFAALGATLALHALVLVWAIHDPSPARELRPPGPIRIEFRPRTESATPPPAPTRQSRVAKPSHTTAPAPSPRTGASSEPDPTALPPTAEREVTAALADDFALPEPLPTPPEDSGTTPGASVPDAPVAGTSGAADSASHIASAVNAEGRWRYRIYYGDYPQNNSVALLDYVLRIGDHRYTLHTEGQATGLLSLFYRGFFRQTSEGAFGESGFLPDRYAEQRGDRPARTVRIDSSGGTRRAVFDDGRTEAVSVSAQDRLSIAAQLAWLAATQSTQLRGRSLEVQLIGISNLRTIRFELTRDLVLETPSGVRHLVRLRSNDGDGGQPGSLEIWLSEDGALMPFRIRIEDRAGQVLDQLLMSE